MAYILTTTEAANVLRCESTDVDMLALLPLVDSYIKNATGRDWATDATIRPEAKAAARMLLVRWHEDPGGMAAGGALGFGLMSCLVQLEALALILADSGVPNEALAIVKSQPANGARNVAVGGTLVVIFNHPMTSDTTSRITLESSGVTAAVTITLDPTTKIATIQPTSALTKDLPYTLHVNHAPDLYGQTLDTEIAFRTED